MWDLSLGVDLSLFPVRYVGYVGGYVMPDAASVRSFSLSL